MFECLIMGDSIAVGIAQHRPECQVVATVGISSYKFAKTHINLPHASLTIISLGSNDGVNAAFTRESLEKIRKSIQTEYVIWILPNYNKYYRASNIIESIAQEYGDGTIDIPAIWLSKDEVHPNDIGYKAIADQTKELPD